MRSSSFARAVIASLGLAVVITPGCGESPSRPSRAEPFSVLSISPAQGSSGGATAAKITGTGFIIIGQGGATVTVDGRPVNANPSYDGKTLSLVMPAHATGKAEVTVTAPLSQEQASVPGGYTYLPLPPPVILELQPNIGSTRGGMLMIVVGSEFQAPLTVSVDGVAMPFEYDDFGVDVLYLLMPAHAAGPVGVIVTNPDGRTASSTFTYASPATFDFNGDWQGFGQSAPIALTIRDNTVVSVSCGASVLALTPPPVVVDGEFSFEGGGGVSITANILGPNDAVGTMKLASCVGTVFFHRKK